VSIRYTLVVDGTTYEVEVNDASIIVDGRAFTVSANGQTVNVNGTQFTVELGAGQATVNGIRHTIEKLNADKAEAGPADKIAARAPVGNGAGAVKAIMPGKVLRLLVKEGDAVNDGDVVLILEAMKMENELRAHKTGTVKAIHVRKGMDVEMGQVLLEIAE
jgi:biotin carboxyl carrier protein